MTPCFVGLGSNLHEPISQVTRAFTELAGLPQTRLLATSRLYGSKAVGPGSQADYINAAAHIETALSAPALLTELQRIEQAHGRQRKVRWGPRTLDLDLLLYGNQHIQTPGLQVPHPGIADRPFVLAPLAELGADPPGIDLKHALDYLAASSLWLISPP